MPFFKADHLVMRFGGLVAVNDFNLELQPGDLVGLIGPNGAGKTTVFNMITGVYRPTSGRIYFQDKDITGKRPDIITALGIARTFQNIRLFTDLSLIENVMVSYHVRLRSNIFEAVFKLPRYMRQENAMYKEAMELLHKVELDHLAEEKAGSLPYGEQRRLEIARALATHPKLLLLDEPAAGMNPNETLQLMDFIKQIRDEFDLTILLIEHDMKVVMGICERIWVLDYGKTIAVGTPSEIQNNPEVIKAYLGEEEYA